VLALKALACSMSYSRARPGLPKGLMVAGAAAIALHVLCTLALGRTGWAGTGAPLRLTTAVRGGSEATSLPLGIPGLHVRLESLPTTTAPNSVQPSTMDGGQSPDGAHLTSVDDAAKALNAIAPAAGGAASLASAYLSVDEVDRAPTPDTGWVLDEAAIERVGRARMRLRLWVSERGRIDRVALLHAEPAGAWVEQAIQPLADTRMRPAERDGRAVAAAIVVELSADLETLR